MRDVYFYEVVELFLRACEDTCQLERGLGQRGRPTLISSFVVVQHLPVHSLEERLEVRIPSHGLGVREWKIIRSASRIIPVLPSALTSKE